MAHLLSLGVGLVISLALAGPTNAQEKSSPAQQVGRVLDEKKEKELIALNLALLSKYFDPRDSLETILKHTVLQVSRNPLLTNYIHPEFVAPSATSERLYFVPFNTGVYTTSEVYCIARQRIVQKPKPNLPDSRAANSFNALPQCIEVPTANMFMAKLAAGIDSAEKGYYLKKHETLLEDIALLKKRLSILERLTKNEPDTARAKSGKAQK